MKGLLLLCLSTSSAFIVVLLAQILLEARKPVHDEEMQQQRHIQHAHGNYSVGPQGKTHESHKEDEKETSHKCIEKAEVSSN